MTTKRGDSWPDSAPRLGDRLKMKQPNSNTETANGAPRGDSRHTQNTYPARERRRGRLGHGHCFEGWASHKHTNLPDHILHGILY